MPSPLRVYLDALRHFPFTVLQQPQHYFRRPGRDFTRRRSLYLERVVWLNITRSRRGCASCVLPVRLCLIMQKRRESLIDSRHVGQPRASTLSFIYSPARAGLSRLCETMQSWHQYYLFKTSSNCTKLLILWYIKHSRCPIFSYPTIGNTNVGGRTFL